MDMSEAKYANLHLEDHDRDDRSSTEVEESLIGGGDDKYTRDFARPQKRRNRCLSMLNSSRWFVDTILLLVILGLLVRERMDKPPVNPWDFGGDLTGVSGHFPQQVKTFRMDYEGKYAPNDTSKFFTDEVLNNWNELMPSKLGNILTQKAELGDGMRMLTRATFGMGFQWVNDTHKYHDLPTPIVWPEKTVFTTSVTHQLHCLFAVVQTYSGLKSGHEIPDDHHWHMIHCFSYLRETIMCSADMALEGLETTFPDHNGGSDGWDSKHVCKDYNAVKNYLESVRAYDDREIF